MGKLRLWESCDLPDDPHQFVVGLEHHSLLPCLDPDIFLLNHHSAAPDDKAGLLCPPSPNGPCGPITLGRPSATLLLEIPQSSQDPAPRSLCHLALIQHILCSRACFIGRAVISCAIWGNSCSESLLLLSDPTHCQGSRFLCVAQTRVENDNASIWCLIDVLILLNNI